MFGIKVGAGGLIVTKLELETVVTGKDNGSGGNVGKWLTGEFKCITPQGRIWSLSPTTRIWENWLISGKTSFESWCGQVRNGPVYWRPVNILQRINFLSPEYPKIGKNSY